MKHNSYLYWLSLSFSFKIRCFSENNLMPTGRLFTYNTAKGYGFITHGNNEKDVFVHASELSKAGIELTANVSLAGLMLEYEIGLGKHNKKQALNIKVVDNDKICVNHKSKKVVLNKINITD